MSAELGDTACDRRAERIFMERRLPGGIWWKGGPPPSPSFPDADFRPSEVWWCERGIARQEISRQLNLGRWETGRIHLPACNVPVEGAISSPAIALDHERCLCQVATTCFQEGRPSTSASRQLEWRNNRLIRLGADDRDLHQSLES